MSIPVNADIERSSQYASRAVSADEITRGMREAGARLNFLILDACRNNPLPRSMRDGAAGLAAMTPAQDFLIAYSTSPGSVATDGEGVNSPYTAALAGLIVEPNIEVDALFRRVTSKVTEAEANIPGFQLPGVQLRRHAAVLEP